MYITYHVKGQRPAEVMEHAIPADWLIFNAPRPLLASSIPDGIPSGIGEFYLAWQGDFIHGVFYAAVDPANTDIVNHNIQDDGWVLAWHAKDEIVAWVKDYYETHYPGFDIAKYSQKEVESTFFAYMNKAVR